MDKVFSDVWSSFLQVGERVVELLQGEISMVEFQENLRLELDNAGQQITARVAEAADRRLLEKAEERQGWVVGRRDDPKELLTVFGPVKYRRTYFRNKNTGKYRYLVDEMLGVTAHQRVDLALKAQLAAKATEVSYRKSGAWSPRQEWQVSGQTVMRALRDAKTSRKQSKLKQKRHVQYLFIEADEDHVASQEGKSFQPRLVYVHEGVSKKAKRHQLRNARYFGGLHTSDVEGLWNKVWHYIDETYDLENVAAILVSGDGASWIRGACEYIPGSVFVLDRYHVHQYVTAATSDKNIQVQLWKALNAGERKLVLEALSKAESQAETENRKKSAKDAERYFMRNWDGILAWKIFSDVWPGCSAEGHVSHIYSARLSSRPMAWTKAGVEKMACLRVMEANGDSVKAAYLEDKPAPVLRVSEQGLKATARQLKQSSSISDMGLGNIPALNGPLKSWMAVLRKISNAS